MVNKSSSKNKGKVKKQALTKSNLGNRFKQNWYNKYPILLFALGFGVLMGLFYAFWVTDFFIQNILNPVASANAWLSGAFLNIFGFDIQVAGYELTSGQFSLSIRAGCDAMEPMAIYTFALLLFPVSIKFKIPGLVIGIILLIIINQIRIISLYFFGVYTPGIFEMMHIQVWQVFFILITLAILAYWIIWALKKEASMKLLHAPS